MRAERQERPPVKACPHWARFAQSPSKWIIAHCSDEEEHEEVWEGPLRSRKCNLGYPEYAPAIEPSIILWYPESNVHRHMRVLPLIPTNVWNQIVDMFILHTKDWGDERPPSGRQDKLLIEIREILNTSTERH